MSSQPQLSFASPAPISLCDRLAQHFKAHAWEEIDARDLLAIAGFGGWRTRISNLRYPPFNMDIRNRVSTRVLPDGTRITDSFYRYLPANEESAA